jgi:very-short-patch-repair endonuclease
MTKGERYIKKYLDDNNIIYNLQFRFDNCKLNRPLPFDFYLPNLNLCIEYDGIQHFEVDNKYAINAMKFFGGEQSKIKRNICDNIKSSFCRENNIKLIRISYLDIKNIKSILDEVFKEI